MKSIQTLIVASLTSCLCLLGCSGGSNTIIEGTQCSLKKPISMDIGSGQSKLDLGQAPTLLASGTYDRTQVDFYYEETAPNAESNFRIWVQDKKQLDNSFKTKISCIRNASQAPEDLIVSVKAVTQMVVTQNTSVSSTVNQYGFRIEPSGKIVADNTPKPDEKPSLPGDVYAGSSETFLLKTNEQDYEVRSSGNVLNDQGAVRGHYYLSVTYHRQ